MHRAPTPAPRTPAALLPIAALLAIAALSACASDGTSETTADTLGSDIQCVRASDCPSGLCINGACMEDETEPPIGDSDGTSAIPPDVTDTGEDTGDGTADPDGTGDTTVTDADDTGDSDDTDDTGDSDSGEPTDDTTPDVFGLLETCRGTAADCSAEGAACVRLLLRDPQDPTSGLPIFPDDPELGLCTRDCSPLVDEDGLMVSRSAQCDQIEAAGQIADWICQVVATDTEDWQTARAASICRPEIRGADSRTGTCFACVDDANCADGLCVNLGRGGHTDQRCAALCNPETTGDCGFGFSCESTTSIGGTTTNVCVPTTGTCTDCIDRDGDGHGIGACEGRDCDDENPLRFEGNPETCNGLDSNCDGTVDTGFASGTNAEGDPVYDTLTACGACGQPCPSGINNTTYSCEPLGATYGCTPTCATGYSTCGADISPDPNDAPACSFNIRNDPESCGEDCTDCAEQLGSSQVFCDQGTCRFTNCPAGTASCVDPESNLCETDIVASTAHCGACDNDCDDLPNTDSTSCTQRTCSISTCANGFANCNASTNDGCETNTNTSRDHCGSCNNACAGTATCSDGTCSCSGTQTYCPGLRLGEGGCYNLNTDSSNCGQCGRSCPFNSTCSGGQCVCNQGFTLCGTQCVDTSSNPFHCGQCNFVCPGWGPNGDGFHHFCQSGFCMPDCGFCPPGDMSCIPC